MQPFAAQDRVMLGNQMARRDFDQLRLVLFGIRIVHTL